MPIEILEKYLTDLIFPQLQNGRLNWDMPHTIAVVHHIKKILQNNKYLALDEPVLIIAAYTHDWGYAEMYSQGKRREQKVTIDDKVLHMELGAKKTLRMLESDFFSFLTSTQKSRIVHLVSVHDKLTELKDADELVLMEADTLGALDIGFIIPTFDKETNIKFMDFTRQNRLPLFITEYSKEAFQSLFDQRLAFFNEH